MMSALFLLIVCSSGAIKVSRFRAFGRSEIPIRSELDAVSETGIKNVGNSSHESGVFYAESQVYAMEISGSHGKGL